MQDHQPENVSTVCDDFSTALTNTANAPTRFGIEGDIEGPFFGLRTLFDDL